MHWFKIVLYGILGIAIISIVYLSADSVGEYFIQSVTYIKDSIQTTIQIGVSITQTLPSNPYIIVVLFIGGVIYAIDRFLSFLTR